MLENLKNLCGLTVVTGHFGTGKTNFSVNLAKEAVKAGRPVTLIDLDIVNPYFRAADNREELEALGVRCIIPTFANTNVDIPTLPPDVFSAFEEQKRDPERLTIFDVGGDNGAVALGMYNRYFAGQPYDLLYVINAYRPLTEEAADAKAILDEIEYLSRLKATGLVNNSNLGCETTASDIREGLIWAEEIAKTVDLPLLCTTAMKTIAPELSDVENLFAVTDATKRHY